MQRTIISDTSCIILLDKIGELEILKNLFTEITITSAIKKEFGQPLPGWFVLKDPSNLYFQQEIENSLDKGEASAIALAIEVENCLLIIDDLKGRNFADNLGIKIIGTIGLMFNAKKNGIIPSVKSILIKIRNTNFRMNSRLEEIILKNAGE